MIITANAVFWIAFLIMVLWVMVAIAEADNDFVSEVEVFVSEVEAGDVVTFTNYFGESVTGEVVEVVSKGHYIPGLNFGNKGLYFGNKVIISLSDCYHNP